MSYNRQKEFADKSKELERQLFDEQGNLRQEPLTTPEPEPTPEPTPEPEPEPTPGPDPVPEPTPEPTVEEKKYKDAVKAMNEAQREAAELRKAQKDQADKQAELEKRLNEILESKKKEPPKPVEPEDDLEQDLPDVAKIAERKVQKARAELEARLAEFDQRLAAEEAIRKQKADEQAGMMIVQDVLKVHPDYPEIVNSDALKTWIENDAPPLYKAVYEGKVAATARDIVEVINQYKSTLTPPKVTSDKPSDKTAPVKTPVNPTTKPNKPAPLTQAEIIEFQNRGHRWSKEQRDEFNKRLEAMFSTT